MYVVVCETVRLFSLIKHFCVVILCMRVSESEKPSERGIKGTNRERERERGEEKEGERDG